MKTVTKSLDERVGDVDAQVKEILGELNRTRTQDHGSYGRRIVKALEPGARAWQQGSPVFKNKASGEFDTGLFIREVARAGEGSWRNSAALKSYVEYIEKALPTGMSEMTLEQGGVLVPPQFVNQLLMRTYENDLLARCTSFPMTSNLLTIPAVNETSRADGSRWGGARAFWEGESQQMTETKPGFQAVEIKPQTLTFFVRATNQFIEDASTIAVEQWLNMIAEMEMNFVVGNAIVNGTGTGQMQGILNAPSLITVAKDTGQAAATLTANNIVKMWARLHQSCRKNAVWLYDQSIEPGLLTMTIGTAGAQLAVFLPPGGLSDKPYGTILGRPALPVEFCQQLGTAGDIILWDPTTYIVGMRQAIQAAMSIHVAFATNESMFRFTMRLSGKNWWTSPLTPKSGGNTQGCVIDLATRA